MPDNNICKVCIRFLLLAIFFNLSAHDCFGQSKWEKVTFLNQKDTLTSVLYVNNRFVAVGAEGVIITSSDGIHWKRQNSGRTDRFNSVAYGNGWYVAVGSGASFGNKYGIIINSTDGIAWSVSKSTDKACESIIYGEDQFVVLNGGYLLSSKDGEKWMQKFTKGCGDISFSSLCCTNGRIFAIGIDYSLKSSIAICNDMSTEDATWSLVYKDDDGDVEDDDWEDDGHTELKWLGYLNNNYIAVGRNRIIASVDGKTWDIGKIGRCDLDYYYSVAYGNSKYVAIGTGGIFSSSDGWKWSKDSFESPEKGSSIAYGNNRFVIVGCGGMILTSP